MLRGNAASPTPRARGLAAETDTHPSHARGRGPRGTIEHHGLDSTFEPDDVTSLKLTGHLASLADDDVHSPSLRHQRQQSTPTFPLLRANTRSQSPSKLHKRHQSQDMPLTGDGRGRRRQENSPGAFAGWLSGTSTPSVDGATSPDPTSTSKRGGTPHDTIPTSATQSRFGFLASSVSALTTRLTNQPQTGAEVDDELCNLDIEAVVYPSSSPSDCDTFSPAAYKNLQGNASGLLHKMQDAYRQRVVELKMVQAEREAQEEESEEAELRVRHFKSQLEKMAAKAADQEQAMQQLMAELHAEKKARHEERVSRDKILAEGSVVTEDLGVDDEERKRWRNSDGTVRSDMSIDTDRESAESESVFSRSRSPTVMTNITERESIDMPAGLQAKIPTINVPKPKSAQQLTTFQKLVKGISGETVKEGNEGTGPDGCKNCQGQESSVAWDTVSLLRDENRGLKHRVAQLEVVVEGALDVVNGIGI